MKTSKLNKLAWVFFALALGITTVQAQYRANRNYTSEVENHSCVNDLTGLSEDQKTQILAMEEAHEKNMDVLREKRRSTRLEDEKTAIREDMIETRVNHRNQVKSILTPDQQKQYDQLHAEGNKHLHQNTQGNRSGSGNGSHRFNGNRNSSYGHGNKYYSNSCNRSQSYGNGRGRGNRL